MLDHNWKSDNDIWRGFCLLFQWLLSLHIIISSFDEVVKNLFPSLNAMFCLILRSKEHVIWIMPGRKFIDFTFQISMNNHLTSINLYVKKSFQSFTYYYVCWKIIFIKSMMNIWQWSRWNFVIHRTKKCSRTIGKSL